MVQQRHRTPHRPPQLSFKDRTPRPSTGIWPPLQNAALAPHSLQPARAAWGGTRRDMLWRGGAVMWDTGERHLSMMTQLPSQPGTTHLWAVKWGEKTSLLICGAAVQETETTPDLRSRKGFSMWSEVLPQSQEGMRLMTEPPKITLRIWPKWPSPWEIPLNYWVQDTLIESDSRAQRPLTTQHLPLLPVTLRVAPASRERRQGRRRPHPHSCPRNFWRIWLGKAHSHTFIRAWKTHTDEFSIF